MSAALIQNVQSIMWNSDADSGEETFALDESACDTDLHHLWHEYWLAEGEKIVWASWVAKYQNYINSEYIENLSAISESEEVKSSEKGELPELMSNLDIMESTTSEANICDATLERNEIDRQDSDNVLSPQPLEETPCDTKSASDSNANEQWQTLWNDHYEEQYNKSYTEFVNKKRKIGDDNAVTRIGSGTDNTAATDEEPQYSFYNEYNEEMNDLGLPTAFGRRKNRKEDYRNASLDNLSTSTGNSEKLDESILLDAEKPKRKRSKKKRRPLKSTAELPEEIANDKTLMKYWSKRFSLFSRFDLGIKLDRESWFSVTPEKVAAHTASKCQCDVIVDAFCGAGGNTIQFAKTCRKVIAIDIDPLKIEMAKHNAGVYGVADKIEFIVGNYMELAGSLVADVVFLSPPWGGPEYLKNDVYDIEEFLIPVPATELMAVSRRISPNVCLYLPRNSNKTQLCVLAGPGNTVEVNQEFLGPRLIAITAYYGDLFKNKE